MDTFDWTCPTCSAKTSDAESAATTEPTSDEEDHTSPITKTNMNQIKVMMISCNSLVSTSKRAQCWSLLTHTVQMSSVDAKPNWTPTLEAMKPSH